MKKKKKKKPQIEQVDDGLGGANEDSDISTPGPLSDDSSYDQVDSSFASDFSSPLHSEVCYKLQLKYLSVIDLHNL